MSRAFITEFAAIRSSPLPIAALPALAQQTIQLPASGPVNSAPLHRDTRYVRIICEAQCSIRLGGPAQSNDMMLPAMTTEYFAVSGVTTISIIPNPRE